MERPIRGLFDLEEGETIVDTAQVEVENIGLRREVMTSLLGELKLQEKDGVLGESIASFLNKMTERGGLPWAASAQQALDDSDLIGALCILASTINPGPATKSDKSLLGRTRKQVRQALKAVPVVEKRQPPLSFTTGTSGHRMYEDMIVAGDNFDYLNKKHVDLKISDGQVRGVTISDKASDQAHQLALDIPGIHYQSDSVREVIFTEPLPVPREDQTRGEWLVDIYKDCIAQVKASITDLPSRPHDVDKLLESPVAQTADITHEPISFRSLFSCICDRILSYLFLFLLNSSAGL